MTRRFAFDSHGQTQHGSPRPASGRGAGGEGRTTYKSRTLTFDRSFSKFELHTSNFPNPPHPQPFSPAEPGVKGARTGDVVFSRRPQIPKRRGQSLILVFFVLIALAGVLALTFDYGFVLLARRQMQTGVNAAALEGMRGKGSQGVNVTDDERRADAQKVLHLNFDDDLNFDDNATTIGAGIDSSLVTRVPPKISEFTYQTELGDGSGTANLLANRSQYIYRPDIQLNLTNEPHGDMVFGFYDRNQDSHSEFVTSDKRSYERDDFVINKPASPDPTTDFVDAFLVRMRRTNDPHGIDRVSGISSSGGGLPMMLGHFGWILADQPNGSHDIRRDGTVVRASAIAASQPIVAVFATSQSSESSVYQLLPYTIFIDGGNEVWRDTPLTELLADDPNNTSADLLPLRCSIGKEVISGASTTTPIDPEGYVAVVSAINSVERIVGFRLLGSTESRFRNDSPRLQDAWPSLPTDADHRQAVIDANRNSNFKLDSSPALVRTVR
jgi:hypothetical protein